MLTLHDIYNLYFASPTSDGGFPYKLMGRWILYDGELHILEDHYNFLKNELTEGKITTDELNKIAKWENSQYWYVIRESDLQAGHYKDFIPEIAIPRENESVENEISDEESKPDTFIYQRENGEPITIEFRQNHFWTNGHEIVPEELDQLLNNVKNKIATISYKKSEQE